MAKRKKKKEEEVVEEVVDEVELTTEEAIEALDEEIAEGEDPDTMVSPEEKEGVHKLAEVVGNRVLLYHAIENVDAGTQDAYLLKGDETTVDLSQSVEHGELVLWLVDVSEYASNEDGKRQIPEGVTWMFASVRNPDGFMRMEIVD